jgi:hypothetical protein
MYCTVLQFRKKNINLIWVKIIFQGKLVRIYMSSIIALITLSLYPATISNADGVSSSRK